MTLGDAKKLIYETVGSYFPGAMIVWEKTKGVTPKPPYITLGYKNLERSLFPLKDDEGEHRYYNYAFTLEMNLYTIGKEIEVNGTPTGSYENTALEDIEEFIRYLDSEEITDKLSDKEISVVLNPPIRDLSEIIGSTKFNYRSMCEFSVTFVGLADGLYGVQGSKMIPNSSGGGLETFADTEMPAIENVIIQEET